MTNSRGGPDALLHPPGRLRIYIAGPISGYDIPERVATWRQAADEIKAKGHEAVIPEGLVQYPYNDGHEWSWYLTKDIILLVGCDAIVLLPNWLSSKGANLERHVAQALGLLVFEALSLVPESPVAVGQDAIKGE